MKKDRIIRIGSIIFAFIMLVLCSFMISNYNRKLEVNRKYTVTTIKLNNINIDDYLEILKKDELSFIYIGKSSCEYCIKQNKILKEILDEYKITIYYLNIKKFTSTEINNKIIPTYSDFSENGLATPTLMLVKNGEVVKYMRGLSSKEKIINTLKESDYI